MAFINGLYIFVDSEDTAEDVEGSSHSVEQGIDITDTVKQTPEEISISGTIVDYSVGKIDYTAKDTRQSLRAIKNAGTLVTYSNGDEILTSMQILGFSTSRSKDVAGGYTYSMTLKKVRIVKNAYVAQNTATKDGGKQQVDKGENDNVYYTVKKGDCVAALVAEPKAPYKNLKREGAKSGYWGACNWVMEKNPSAFSRKGDFRTLQIGKKILLGAR